MSRARTLAVLIGEEDQRLDRWFKRRFPDLSHGRLEKLLRSGQIRVDGKRAKAGDRILVGQQIRIPPQLDALAPGTNRATSPVSASVSKAEAARLRASVLYEDDWLILIDKPTGLAVQGGSRQTRHLDAMLGALVSEGTERPRLVHRLDKDTSGVMALAKTRLAAKHLTSAFKDKATEKLYWALVHGRPPRPEGRVDLPLAKKSISERERVTAQPGSGDRAITLYAIVEERAGITWLLLRPITGRTHQLRIHCAESGFPIVGDEKYGVLRSGAISGLPRRLCLHARELAIPHPEDGTTLRVVAPPPPHIAEALTHLDMIPAKSDSAAERLRIYAASQHLQHGR